MTIETSTSTKAPSSRRRRINPQMARLPTASPGGACVVVPPGAAVGALLLAEPDGAVAMAERGEVQSAFAGHESGDLRAVGVDQVVEERNDVPALVVLELLHLVLERDPLGLVDLGQRLLVQGQVVRIRRRPVALVVWGGRDAPVGHLRQVVTGAPEVD